MKLSTAVGVLCMLMGCLAYAQNGTIKGVVTEKETDTILARASVFLDGTSLGTRTNTEGKYEISNVPPGDYKLIVNYPRKQYKKIVEITLAPGQTLEMNVAVGQEVKRVHSANKTTLTQFVKKQSSAAAVNEKKKETKSVSTVSGDDMSNQGKSNVGDAARAVSGVSLENGKYANIRGLNGRYVKTTLNYGEIPGLDPDRNAVQLDLFPTSFLSGLTVVKTFAPDVPGDFAGGLINIKTKDAPDSLTIKLSASGKFNPQVHMRGDFLTYEGGKSDWLGYDDGTRSAPADVSYASNNGDMPSKSDVLTNPTSKAYSTWLGRQFNPVMDAKDNTGLGTNKGFLDHSFNLTIGNTIRKKDTAGNYIPSTKKLGYFLGVNYKRTYSFYDDGQVGRYELTGNIDDVSSLNGSRQFTKAQSKDNVLFGTLASLNYQNSANSKFKINYIHNHSGTNRVARSSGFDDAEPTSEFRVTELDYVQRSIDNVQLIGEQKFHTGKKNSSTKDSEQKTFKNGEHKLDWIASAVFSSQTQPDYRVFSDEVKTLSDGTVQPEINPTNYSLPFRFYRYMKETNYDAKANYKIAMHQTDTSHLNYKFGISANLKDRRFEEYRYNYEDYSGVPPYNGNPDDYVATENIGNLPNGDPGLLLFETSQAKNRYDGFRLIPAGYAMADFNIGKKMDFIGGIRGEYTMMKVTSDDPTKENSEINEFSYLPSLTLNYHLLDGKRVKDKVDTTRINSRDMQLRFAANKTLARPSFREIAPYEVDDFVRKLVISGTPGLEMTDIYNFDIAWELYPRANEMVTVSGFYKYFVNPMGLFSDPLANIPTFAFQNIEYSTVFGMEVEFKKNLDIFSKKLKNFTFMANVTLVKSVTPIPEEELAQIRQTDPYRSETRPLAGQSPYLINAGLEYKVKKSGIITNLTFNVFGDRLAVYSNDGRPDIYEKARPELNWNFKKELSKKLSMTLRIKNILNPSYRWAYEYKGSNAAYDKFDDQEANFTSYKKGVSFGLGLAYKFK